MDLAFDAVLFARDGTLIRDVPYNGDPSRAAPVPCAREMLRDLRAHVLRTGVVSNQSGIGRGLLTEPGIDRCGTLAEVPAEEWENVVKVNLFGTAAVVRAALPHLQNGGVVTVASTLGLRAVSDATAYCDSKFGVVGFTRALAAETAGRVGVTLVVPGGMRTNFLRRPDRTVPADRSGEAEPAGPGGRGDPVRADPAEGLRGARTRSRTQRGTILAIDSKPPVVGISPV